MPYHPLYVALVWHMHQPYYRDARRGEEIILPWVRLHAAKDYLHMGEVLAAHPAVHLTINMVPSLTDQMMAWAGGEEADRLVLLAEQPDWSADDKRTILNLAFSISWDRVIRRHRRYAELLDRRPQALVNPDAFSAGDYRDLLAWFNLVWVDPNWRERDAVLAALVAKGRDYTTDDLIAIHAKQREIAGNVLPLYQQLAAAGQLEIITSPYYHPILPLLIDSAAARRASPDLPLPAPPFSAPEDAAAQLQLAVEAHTRHFGAPPVGLWPSEGAVSPEALMLALAAGFRWVGSDEAILGRSLGRPIERDGRSLVTYPRALYRPYRTMAGAEMGPYMIFRDHELSDRIGFLYAHLPGPQAAEDLVYRLLEIRNRINDPENPYLVSIILDGENCWEHYEHNGDPFLSALYRQLSERPELKSVTVAEYIAGIDPRPAGTLARPATGSWIGGDLTTWIGDPEHSRAWEALAQTRAFLVRIQNQEPDAPGLPAAWQALYAAEGSDWFWWYSHRNRSDQDAIFDELFRNNLATVYEALGSTLPPALQRPIYRAAPPADEPAAAGYASPRLTAAAYAADDWAEAARLRPAEASTGAMQRAEGVIERLFVGHDLRNLYLRLELNRRLNDYEVQIYLDSAAGGPVNQRPQARRLGEEQARTPLSLGWLIRQLPGQPAPFLFQATGGDPSAVWLQEEQTPAAGPGWRSVSPVAAAIGERVLEAAVPLLVLGSETREEVRLIVMLAQHGAVVAQLPDDGMAQIVLRPIEHLDPRPGRS